MEKKEKLEKSKQGSWFWRNKLILLFFIIILISLIPLAYYLINSYYVLEKKEFYASIKVEDVFGVDVNGTALKFGVLPPGNLASKQIYLTNRYDTDVKVKIFITGNITEFITISANDFVLKKNEGKTVSFEAFIPKETEYGNYEGKVYFIFYRN